MTAAHRISLMFLAVVAGSTDSASIAQGRLGQMRNEVRNGVSGGGGSGGDASSRSNASSESNSKPESKSSNRSYFSDDGCEDDDSLVRFGVYVTAYAVGYTLALPFLVPRAIAGDDGMDDVAYPDYPYENGHYGYLMLGPEWSAAPKDWSAMGELSYGTNFDELERIGGRLVLENKRRLGLDAEVQHWRELTIGGVDRQWLGDSNLVLRFAESPRFQWRAGLGVNWMGDAQGVETGFNFTYGGELFPADPWVLSAVLDWGTLGKVGLFHGRVTAGMTWRGNEAFVGFDYLDIGDTQIRTVVAGVRRWF